MIEDLITQAIVKLFDTERFYAELIINMHRIVGNHVPTMGVAIKDSINLYINPEFFKKLTLKERVALLKHECGHILNDHIPRFKDMAPELYDAKTTDAAKNIVGDMKHFGMNIAADLSLNCNIYNLPTGAQLPKKYKLPNGETFDWYLNKLKESAMEFEDGIDMHQIWNESEGLEEVLREKIRQAVNDAAVQTRKAGMMTADNELLVSRLNNKSRDWKADFRRFIARTRETQSEHTRKKRNRRFGLKQPGRRKLEQLTVGVAIDTSGSMSDEALNQAMAEIGNMSLYATVWVVEADSEVKDSYKYDPKKVYSFKGRGGTAYQPAFDFFNDNHEIDACIYIGDMDCFDKQKIQKPTYPVLWAVIGSQSPPVDWGFKTTVEVRPK